MPLFDLEQIYSAEGTVFDTKSFVPVAAPPPQTTQASSSPAASAPAPSSPAPAAKSAAPPVVDTRSAAVLPSPAAVEKPPSPIRSSDPAPQTFEIPALKKVARPPSPVKNERPIAAATVDTSSAAPAHHYQVSFFSVFFYFFNFKIPFWVLSMY